MTHARRNTRLCFGGFAPKTSSTPQKKLRDKPMRERTALQQVRLQWEPKNSYFAYVLCISKIY
jgi:hypothetical protein